MTILVNWLVPVLFANAFISFFIAFFWQVKVIFMLLGVSDWENAYVPWKAPGKQNSPQGRFGRFLAGEIFPELRLKWLKAIAYVALSFVTLFGVVGLILMFTPELLN